MRKFVLISFMVAIVSSFTHSSEVDSTVNVGSQYLQGIPGLIEKLGDEDIDVVLSAQDSLIKIGSAAVSSLIQALDNNSDVKTRMHIIAALGMIGDAHSIPALVRGIKKFGKGDGVIASADALGRIGEASIDSAVALSAEKDPEFRRAAMPVFLCIAEYYQGRVKAPITHVNPRITSALIGLLHDNDESVRLAAVRVLGIFYVPEAMEALEKVYKEDRSQEVRSLAQAGIKRLKTRSELIHK